MNLTDATALAKRITPDIGIVEQVMMQAPPDDLESYVVVVRTPDDRRVVWIGPEKWTLKEIRDALAIQETQLAAPTRREAMPNLPIEGGNLDSNDLSLSLEEAAPEPDPPEVSPHMIERNKNR